MRIPKNLGAGLVVGLVAISSSGCLSQPSEAGGATADGGAGTVEIMYGFTDTSSDKFQAEINAFAEAEGIDVQFSPTPDFNSLIATRVSGGNTPDIAIFPQPGIMADFAGSGDLVDLSDVVESASLEAMVPGIVEAGQVDGSQYALPMSLNVKSIVFYPKAPFKEAGYTAPDTLQGLLDLTEEIKTSGTAPWCFGIESGPGTGWPATDWVENLVLIQNGPDVYQQWVDNEIPFDGPEVSGAVTTMADLLLADGNVNGGRVSIASNNFNTAANAMFDAPPGCFMYRQGNFIARDGGFPDDVLESLDDTVGVFPMPGQTPDDKPVLGGGDLASMFTDSEDARKIMNYMATAEFGAEWAQSSGFVSPRTDFDPANYPNDLTRQMAEVAYQSAFVFDGSDQMPGEVGSGSFWREMTAYISGSQDEQATLEAIEASWPAGS